MSLFRVRGWINEALGGVREFWDKMTHVAPCVAVHVIFDRERPQQVHGDFLPHPQQPKAVLGRGRSPSATVDWIGGISCHGFLVY